MPFERIHVYELLEPLSRGGPGLGFRARVAEPGGPFEPGTVVWFRSAGAHEVGGESGIDRLTEAHGAARRVTSPRVLGAADYGVLHGPEGRRFWSVSPWTDGKLLAEILVASEVVPDMLTESVLRGIAEGLAELHAAGFSGVSVTPETVLLLPDTSVLLAEPAWSLARTCGWPRDGRPTPAMLCAAPETIVRPEVASERADLFSAGALAFRAMTGRWHRPEDARALHVSAADMPGLRPSDERPRASLFLSEVVHTLLAADPAERFPTAAALVEALTARRSSAWWKKLHIDQDTHDEEPARRPRAAEPALPPIPAPVAPPDAEWFEERAGHARPIDDHPSPCLGRDAEQEALVREAGLLTAQGGSVVLVKGPGGIGKTRLLDAFLQRIAAPAPAAAASSAPAPQTVPIQLHGTHRRIGVGRPFGAVTEALTRYLGGNRTVDASDVARLLGDACAIAGPFAALLSSDVPPASSAKLSRELILGAFARCFRTLSLTQPIVLVVENLQWADPESLDLVAHLGRLAPNLPLLVVASYRPADAAAIESRFAEVAARGRVRTVHLEPLPAGTAAELVRGIVEPHAVGLELGSRLHRTLGGNPGILLEALRLLETEGALARLRDGRFSAKPALSGAALPQTPTDVALRRIAELPEDERRYVLAAAVQGAAFDIEVARIAAGTDPREGVRIVASLEARGVFTRGGVARRFASNLLFDHAHEPASPEMVRTLHDATAAAFLETRNPLQLPPSQVHGVVSFRVAWHYLRAGRHLRGLLYVSSALDHLRATWRLGDADRLTSAAWKALAQEKDRATELLDLLLERARILGLAGRSVEQRQALDEGLRLARERTDMLREARFLAESARALAAAGDHDASVRDASLAVTQARRSGDDELVLRARILQASSLFRAGRSSEAPPLVSEALEIARRRRDDALEAESLQAMGAVQSALGQVAEAEESHTAALRAFRALGDLPHEAEALVSLGLLAGNQDDPVRAEGLLRRALAILAAYGDGPGESRVLAHLAMILQESGNLLEARNAHRACVERSVRHGQRAAETIARLNLATAESSLGRLEEARDEYGEALRAARDLSDGRLQGYALTGLGESARQLGQWDVARDLFKKAASQFRRAGDPSGLVAALLAGTRCETFTGDPERARSMASETHRLAEQQNARQVSAVSGMLLALLDARDGNADDAGRRIAEANVAVDGIRTAPSTRVELLFLQSLVLRVLRRATEADRVLLQAESAAEEALADLPPEDRARVAAGTSPYREITAGANDVRSRETARPSRDPRTDTVAVG